MAATLWFIGVSTGRSLINAAFPVWIGDLGRDLRLVGRDLPPGSPPERYRALVAGLRADPSALGAVITTHKVAVARAAGDLIDEWDALAVECGEINSLLRTPTGLAGFARDPLSIGRVVDEIWPAGEEVACLGAGGSAIALGRHLISRPEPPARLVFADPDESAAAHLRAVLSPWSDHIAVRVGPGPWDDLVAAAPPGTLVVNATGLGKDRPGSPLTAGAGFPPGAVVWELNYRGDLALLWLARERGVEAYDGWNLFCHGWAAALGPILGLPDEVATARRFADLAAPLRP